MSFPWFFCPDIIEGTLSLSAEEARHASGARRLRINDELTVFDGQGRTAAAHVLISSSRELQVGITAISEQAKILPEIEVAVAVPKGKRLQIMIEKLTELGVSVITPVRFERSVAKGGGEPLEKWTRWSIEACKQSRRAWLPEIRQQLPLADYLSFQKKTDVLFLADPQGDCTCEDFFSYMNTPATSSVKCIIGPEGGLTEEESALCLNTGCIPLRLSDNILRIETAAISYASLCSFLKKF